MRFLLSTFTAVSFLVLASCATEAEPACIDNGDCGEGQACLLETCQDVQCLSSSECGIREDCDDETYVCRAGCLESDDCQAGEECNAGTNTCEVYGCRDTDLDCSIGETCSQATGECITDDRGHCDRCEPDMWGDPSGTCRSADAFCLGWEGEPDSFCLLQCEAPTDCPRGYECVDTGQDFDFDGRSDAICSAYCPLLYENGWK